MKKSKLNKLRKKRLAKATNRNWIQKVTDATEGFFLNVFDVIGLAVFVDWYLKHQEAMRYIVFGGITTVVNIVCFALCNLIGMPVLISNSIAWVVAVFVAYITNKYCVFNTTAAGRKDLWREIAMFLLARVGTLVVDELFMWLSVDLWGWNAILMKVLSNIIVMILNFIFSKIFIFKQK